MRWLIYTQKDQYNRQRGNIMDEENSGKIWCVFSSYRGETRSLEYAPTGVVNSRYD